jgi:hypothetical protein
MQVEWREILDIIHVKHDIVQLCSLDPNDSKSFLDEEALNVWMESQRVVLEEHKSEIETVVTKVLGSLCDVHTATKNEHSRLLDPSVGFLADAPGVWDTVKRKILEREKMEVFSRVQVAERTIGLDRATMRRELYKQMPEHTFENDQKIWRTEYKARDDLLESRWKANDYAWDVDERAIGEKLLNEGMDGYVWSKVHILQFGNDICVEDDTEVLAVLPGYDQRYASNPAPTREQRMEICEALTRYYVCQVEPFSRNWSSEQWAGI